MRLTLCHMIGMAFLLSMGIGRAQSSVKASITIEQNEDRISIQPVVQNRGALYLSYNYLLLVKKTDVGNNLSINNQSGKFTLEPGEIKTLSRLQINISKEQNIKAYLYIRDEEENRLITKDSVEIDNRQASVVKERSLMNISGVVVDESKTKMGRDFYDLFYSVYHQYPNKFNFVITITELPFRGLTSKVQVNVQQNTIYEFLGNPNEEYIKHQVAVSLSRLSQYAQSNPNVLSY